LKNYKILTKEEENNLSWYTKINLLTWDWGTRPIGSLLIKKLYFHFPSHDCISLDPDHNQGLEP